ncbi:MAG TPA: hypothetical protein VE961_21755 [Pyrinomonadaceae bacterium]|nr:hypothetical protein [Pyrinomonadaceae bacterium]
MASEIGASELSAPTLLAWWGKRLIIYNVGLVLAGILAFTAYVLVITKFENILFSPGEDWDGFSGIVLVFQAFAYLFMMLVANLCFSLGPVFEFSFKPRNVARYRTVTFSLGFWFSVALPFIVPVSLLFDVAYAKYWHR